MAPTSPAPRPLTTSTWSNQWRLSRRAAAARRSLHRPVGAHQCDARLLRTRRERPSCCRTSNHFDELAPSHELPSDEACNLTHHWTVKGAVHRSEIFPLMSVQGQECRIGAVRNISALPP